MNKAEDEKSNLESRYWHKGGVGEELLLGTFLVITFAWVE